MITYNFIAKEMEGQIVLLLIYDKEDASSVKVNVLKEIIKEEGYPFEPQIKHNKKPIGRPSFIGA